MYIVTWVAQTDPQGLHHGRYIKAAHAQQFEHTTCIEYVLEHVASMIPPSAPTGFQICVNMYMCKHMCKGLSPHTYVRAECCGGGGPSRAVKQVPMGNDFQIQCACRNPLQIDLQKVPASDFKMLKTVVFYNFDFQNSQIVSACRNHLGIGSQRVPAGRRFCKQFGTGPLPSGTLLEHTATPWVDLSAF